LTASAYRPFAVSNKDRIVGIFVIGALFIFLLGFIIPMVRDLSRDDQINFYTELDKTHGIAPSATVSLKGVSVGKVESIKLTDAGKVRVDIALSTDYTRFYTSDLTLFIDSEIAVTSILNGSGLILLQGPTPGKPLPDGAFIKAEAPRGLSSLLEQLDIERLTGQVTTIVSSVEAIATGLENNQETLYITMENLAAVTAELKQVSRDLPAVFNAVELSLGKLDSTIGRVDGLVANSSDDIEAAIANSVTLTHQATLTLARTSALLEAGEPAVEQLPELLTTTDAALKSIDELSQTLNRSWLFGGRKKRSDNQTEED
jgi:phospholipid/cholesterol/gamma-HCH transport system substrate-binding protein